MKSLPLIALSAITAAALAGCGGTANSSSTGGSSPATTSPSATAAALPPVPAGAVMVTLEDYDIMPATITVKPGHAVFYVKNMGKTPHNFTIVDAAGKSLFNTSNFNQGEARVLEADISAATTRYICTQPGHRALGMEGTLTLG